MGRAERSAARLALVLAALAGLPACALRIDPAVLAPHLPSSIPEGVAPDRPRLGIASFVDVRSRDSRTHQSPPLRLRFLSLVRDGENQTGDRSFIGDVAEEVRRDAAATLAHSGIFSEVLLLDPGAIAPVGVDYVLSGRIEELVGVQYQRAELSLWRAGLLRNRYQDASGTARIQYALKRADAVIWSERIESHAKAPGLAIAQAAVDAASLANERMADALYRRLGASPVALRALPVRVLDACGLGRSRSEAVLQSASEVLERELGVRLVPSIESWDEPPGLASPGAVLDAVRRLAPPPGGIVAAFAPLPRRGAIDLESRRFGMATQLGEHALVACRDDDEPGALTLAHEIGHLFGAVHVRDRSSLMHPVASFPGRFLDALNRRVVQVTRTRRFGDPLDPAVAGEIRAIYRAASRFPDDVDAPDVEEALTALPN